jgi:hypothetical protein
MTNPTPAPPPTIEEAHQIMRRFNASHFRLHDQEWARYRIPADHSHDDDLRMSAFIQQVERERAAVEKALAAWDGLNADDVPIGVAMAFGPAMNELRTLHDQMK